MGRPIPGIAAVEVVGAADEKNVVRDADCYVEAEFRRFDEQRRFLYDNGRGMVYGRGGAGTTTAGGVPMLMPTLTPTLAANAGNAGRAAATARQTANFFMRIAPFMVCFGLMIRQ